MTWSRWDLEKWGGKWICSKLSGIRGVCLKRNCEILQYIFIFNTSNSPAQKFRVLNSRNSASLSFFCAKMKRAELLSGSSARRRENTPTQQTNYTMSSAELPEAECGSPWIGIWTQIQHFPYDAKHKRRLISWQTAPSSIVW